ncbi:hypothetical protein LINGRAHAP2_LOCUS15491, partial [Linum grandiflorum]
MQGYNGNGEWQCDFGASNGRDGWSYYPNQHQHYEYQGRPNYYQPYYGDEQQGWANSGQEAMPYWNEHQGSPTFYQNSTATSYHQDQYEECPPYQNQNSRVELSQPSPPDIVQVFSMWRQLNDIKDELLLLPKGTHRDNALERVDRLLTQGWEKLKELSSQLNLGMEAQVDFDSSVVFEKVVEEVEESPLLEDNLASQDGGVEGFEKKDDQELQVEIGEDMGPPRHDIERPKEQPLTWCFLPFMGPMRKTETLQDSCLVLKYLCEENHNACFSYRSRELKVLEPRLHGLEDLSSSLDSLGIFEKYGVPTSFFLAPSQASPFTKHKAFKGKIWSSQSLRLLLQSLRVLLSAQSQSLKKLM